MRESPFSSAAAATLESERVTPASEPLVVAKGRMRSWLTGKCSPDSPNLSRVHLANSGPTNQLADIVVANTTAGDDCDLVARPTEQRRDDRSTVQGRRRAAGRKDSANP